MKLDISNFFKLFMISIVMLFATRCSNKTNNQKAVNLSVILKSEKNNLKNDAEDTLQLPFIGIRHFETRAGVSGTGTPHWLVQIKRNRDVIFFFGQIDQGDDSKPETTGKYYAGKFKKYMRCDFREWDNFPRYYEITKDSIYEVDSSYKRLRLSDCCGLGDNESICPCKGDLWKLETDDSFVNKVSKVN